MSSCMTGPRRAKKTDQRFCGDGPAFCGLNLPSVGVPFLGPGSFLCMSLNPALPNPSSPTCRLEKLFPHNFIFIFWGVCVCLCLSVCLAGCLCLSVCLSVSPTHTHTLSLSPHSLSVCMSVCLSVCHTLSLSLSLEKGYGLISIK